ncbi:MAG TPA: hypothetical protein VIM88_05665 [Sulfurovum sp.]|uniref:hypothetical protein n=1 Tax=Sulfurovum sp. TaxID=1969726 RepID=UPI002F948EEF
MHKQPIITLTFIISGLNFNPVIADTVIATVAYSQPIDEPVSAGIASLLQNRGLEKDAADKISENFVSEKDEVLLALLIQELDRGNIASSREILEYLSTTALHRQRFDLHSYDHLVGMVTKIKQRSLDSKTLKQLKEISKRYQTLFV